jgi:anti-sigma regulatory factor (Ser/Thr protein kinase)
MAYDWSRMDEQERPAQLECPDSSIRAFHSYPAKPPSAARARKAVRAFLVDCGMTPTKSDDILVAAGEAVINSIEHAYSPPWPEGEVLLELYGCPRHRRIVVRVRDQGRMRHRAQTEWDRGRGLRIIESLADGLVIDTNQGTAVTMVFHT